MVVYILNYMLKYWKYYGTIPVRFKDKRHDKRNTLPPYWSILRNGIKYQEKWTLLPVPASGCAAGKDKPAF